MSMMLFVRSTRGGPIEDRAQSPRLRATARRAPTVTGLATACIGNLMGGDIYIPEDDRQSRKQGQEPAELKFTSPQLEVPRSSSY